MRTLLLLPLSIALFSASPPDSQDAPRELFCSGPCFAVDANGVRTPAPKGTTLRPNQRFETGAGAYAQLKLGADAAIAVGDTARVRFEQLPGGTIVNLDVGRLRMIRDSFGKPTRPIELNTADGRFVLRDADVEIKKSQMTSVGANVTAVKVNAGEALLRSPQGNIVVGKGEVQGIIGGKVLPQPIPRTEIALVPPSSPRSPISGPVTSVRLPDVALAALSGPLQPPVLQVPKVPDSVLNPRDLTPVLKAPVTRTELMLQAPSISTDGIKTLSNTLSGLALEPAPIATTGTTVDTRILISDTALITKQTTVTSPTSITVTETAPTLISPTSTTTATLTSTTTVTTTSLTTTTPTTSTSTTTLTQPITSPTISTITQPIVLQPILRN